MNILKDTGLISLLPKQLYDCRYPFDGDGGILAHAFFPYEESDLGGDIHFDNDEKWIDKMDSKDYNGIDFFTVALHELGHSLGLSHTPVFSAVMFPYYNGYDDSPQPQLTYDDILGMYDLYSELTEKVLIALLKPLLVLHSFYISL